jgi:hypothetical protein
VTEAPYVAFHEPGRHADATASMRVVLIRAASTALPGAVVVGKWLRGDLMSIEAWAEAEKPLWEVRQKWQGTTIAAILPAYLASYYRHMILDKLARLMGVRRTLLADRTWRVATACDFDRSCRPILGMLSPPPAPLTRFPQVRLVPSS